MRTTTAARRRFWTRRVQRVLTVLVAVIVGGGLLLASSRGKALVLRSVGAIVQTRLGVEARAVGLDYRITSRGVTLHGVSLTHPGATRPFFSAERVDVDLLPAVLLGRAALKRLEVVKPEVVLDSASRGAGAATRTNGHPAALPPFDIRRVDLRDLALTVVTSPTTQVSVRRLSVALVGEGVGRLRGTALISGALSVKHPAGNVEFERVRADLSLAGTSLSLTSISTDSPVATVGATVRLDISNGAVDATGRTRIDVGQLRQWWSDAPHLNGVLEADGVIRGTLDDPVVTLTGRVARLQWRGVTDATLSASVRWSGGDLVIDPYDVRSKTAGLRLGGRGRVGVAGDVRTSALQVEARADDPNRLALLTGAPPLPGVPLTLVADLTWPGAVPSTAAIEGRLKVTALDPDPRDAPLAMLEATGKGGRWIGRQRMALRGDTRVTADLSLSVDPTTLSRSRVDGHVVVASADLSAAVRDLGRRGLAWENVEHAFRGGRVTADATLAGTLASPYLEASATADSLTIGGIEEVRIDAQVRLQGRSMSISRVTVESSSNRLDLSGAATLGTGPIDLAMDARFERPEALAAWLPPHWRPSGALAFSGRLAGSAREPALAGRIFGSGVEANGIVFDTLESALTFERGVLRVSGLRLRRGEGSLHLDGDIDRSLTHMNLRGRGEKLALFVRELDGAGPLRVDDLSVEIDVTGSPAQPTGHMSSAAGNVAVKGRELGPVTLAATSAAGSVRAHLALANHRADITGSIALAHGWPFETQATLQGSQIAPLLAMVGGTTALTDAAGTLSASAVVTGRLDRLFASSGVVTVSELEGQLRSKPLTLLQPGRIRFDGRQLQVEEPLRMTLGGFSIGLAPPDA
ncbi:MAG TPA: hypothetical protein VFT24_12585, partial [Vicinamibacterales bacterium]|nr:hypothetical protein [Vicinamibacterales bacterium]